MISAGPQFKNVTVDNWLEPDPLYAGLVNLNKVDGTISATTGADWIRYMDGHRLAAEVPEEVRHAFDFAAGAVGYSYFYYPILTLVAQQELRIADFAIDKLFDARGITPKPQSFKRRLEILHKRGLLSDGEFGRWDAIRNLRNHSTHPPWQQNWGHAMSLEIVKAVAEAISDLPWTAKKEQV